MSYIHKDMRVVSELFDQPTYLIKVNFVICNIFCPFMVLFIEEGNQKTTFKK